MQFAQRAVIGFGILASAAATSHATKYNIVTQMWHNPLGSAIGSETWSLTSVGSASPAMTYGPYATDIPSGENLVMTKLQLSPASGSNLTVTWDAEERNRNLNYFLRNLTVNTFKFMPVGMLINMPSASKWEFRIHHFGNGNVQQGNVFVLTEAANKDNEYWPGETAYKAYHQVGYKVTETDMWEAKVGGAGCTPSCGSKWMTYGPYTTLAKGAGDHVAAFRLAIDNVTPATQKVATLDIIYRTATGTVVTAAGRDIFRGDFDKSGTGEMTTFPLEFNNPASNTKDWEFRVKWHAVGVLRQSKTITYKVF